MLVQKIFFQGLHRPLGDGEEESDKANPDSDEENLKTFPVMCYLMPKRKK